ncbi:hypothetical protein [Streptomyces sp. NPDC086023]|uniref:hypothetical protein n=1 Tax=Streptomyces sp. NPDC086023 TaxID=3365746 RepID=UPI0037D39A40
MGELLRRSRAGWGPRRAHDLAALDRGHRAASVHFEDALELSKPGFERVKVTDQVRPAAARFVGDKAARGAAATGDADPTVLCGRAESSELLSREATRLESTRAASSNEVRTRGRIWPPPARPPSQPETIDRTGKHRRTGRRLPHVDAADLPAAYNKRRRPPMGIYRRHQPVHGGSRHLRPDELGGLPESTRARCSSRPVSS